jgi:hypothetical protein
MASKRELKRELRRMIEDVIDECYSIQLYNPKKSNDTNGLIDESVVFYDEMVTEIRNGQSKKDARATINKIGVKTTDLISKLNGLQG